MTTSTVEKAIERFLAVLEPHQKIIVAFSGGKDSLALLHCLSQNTDLSRIKAIHINHQLQDAAQSWADFCKDFCGSRNIPFESKSVMIANTNRKGIEAIARKERYQALFSATPEDAVLVTAHHQQDQTETVLLNLFRGAGLAGLKAMRSHKSWHYENRKIDHYRPFLDIPISAILDYLNKNRLNWVEDKSNQQDKFSRNFVRNRLLPLVYEKWPKCDSSILTTTNIISESLELLDQLAELDLEKIFSSSFSLDLTEVNHLDWSRKKNLIRYWFATKHPNLDLTQTVYSWLNNALGLQNTAAHPVRKMANGCEIRIEGQKLYYFKTIPQPFQLLGFPNSFETLYFDETSLLTHKINPCFTGESVVVRSTITQDFVDFPQLKKWLKKQDVVYWNRKRWPVIEINGEVAAILGYFMDEKFK